VSHDASHRHPLQAFDPYKLRKTAPTIKSGDEGKIVEKTSYNVDGNLLALPALEKCRISYRHILVPVAGLVLKSHKKGMSLRRNM
jgi:hypothetical protein